MSGRFWHLACVNPKTGKVVPLSETDADHLEKFWDANADNPIKREDQTSNVKQDQKSSPTQGPSPRTRQRLHRNFTETERNKKHNSPNTPIRVGGPQGYRFGTGTEYASKPPPPFPLNGTDRKRAAPTALQPDRSSGGKDTEVGGGTLDLSLNGKGNNGSAAEAATANQLKSPLNDRGDNDTGASVPPPPQELFTVNGTGPDVPQPPQEPSTANGVGPAAVVGLPCILYVDAHGRKINRNLTYSAIMLHKTDRWWVLVPEKGGLYENNVCKKHSAMFEPGSTEWWRLAFCGYETKKERTAVTPLRDICM